MFVDAECVQERVAPLSGSLVSLAFGGNRQAYMFRESKQRPTLRPYQNECLEALQDAVDAGRSSIGVMPTGSGKSLVIAALMAGLAESGKRALMLTHVRELIEQDAGTFERCAPDVPFGVFCRGLKRFELDQPVVFAQTQTLFARKHLLTEPFDVMVVDEAHLIPFAGEGRYVSLIKLLRELRPGMPIAGVTATPFRLQGGRLDMGPDAWFSETAYEIGVKDLIDQGFLALLIGQKPRAATIDADSLSIERGDFREDDLTKLVDDDDLNRRIVNEIIRCGVGRQSWLVFAVGVQHAKTLRDLLVEQGISAKIVLGETSAMERQDTISRFRDGSLRAIVNCDTLTTGFDHPGLDLIAVARPTASASLHCQMLGRGTRLAEGKENCLVLDFPGNVFRLGPISAPRVSFTKKSKWGGAKQPSPDLCPRCDTYFDEPPNDRTCAHCGYEKPRPKPLPAPPPVCNFDDVDPLNDTPLKVLQYRTWEHRKPGRPPSLKISYRTEGNEWCSEYLCLFHDGYAGRRAKEAWRKRGGGRYPANINEAVQQASQLRMPSFVSVDTSKGFPMAIPLWDSTREIT